jgi:phosphate-selective porin OprO/OprP
MLRAAIVFAMLALPAAAQEPAEPSVAETLLAKNAIPLHAEWDHALWFVSTDNDYRIHVGGNLQWDSVWLIGPKGVLAEPSSNGTSTQNFPATLLRRARIRLNGSLFDRFDYMIEYDFANAVNENNGDQPPTISNVNISPQPINVWVQMRDVPFFGTVRVGQQVKPIGMTAHTYQGFLPFMERADNMDAFYGIFDEGYATGIASWNVSESERMTWQYGIYRPLQNSYGIALSKYLAGLRVTGLPVYEDDGEKLIHVGLGSTYGDLYQDQFRLRDRAVLRNGPGYALPVLADTGDIPASRRLLIGPEFAAVCGPWTLQSEWAGEFITGTPDGTLFFQGGYLQVLYFLTGEHQDYDKKEGAFGRVVPRGNVARGGCGAWQVGLRFSYLDANSKSIDGGRLYDWTLGLNWFLNPNMKLQINAIATYREAPQGVGSGWLTGVGARAACDF